MTRSNRSARAAGTRRQYECPKCGVVRMIDPGNSMCRRCAAAMGSAAAAKVNKKTALERFNRYASRPSSHECWIWGGYRYGNGYAAIHAGGKQVLAHRWAYEHFVGPIPAGLVIDHLCRNKACVNPGHLEPVTSRENTRRAMRTACVNGHAFTPENTYMHGGKRYCRTCRRERQRKGSR